MKYLLLCALLALTMLAPACANNAPPTLSPEATRAWYGVRVIEDLDLLRDIAIAANAQVPPLISTSTTRNIVRYHETAIILVHAGAQGWKEAVLAGLETTTDFLPPNEKHQLAPYVGLLKTLLKGGN